MDSTEQPKCIDCKHFGMKGYKLNSNLRLCERAGKQETSLVTGDKVGYYERCDIERYSADPSRCGREGKYYEPRTNP